MELPVVEGDNPRKVNRKMLPNSGGVKVHGKGGQSRGRQNRDGPLLTEHAVPIRRCSAALGLVEDLTGPAVVTAGYLPSLLRSESQSHGHHASSTVIVRSILSIRALPGFRHDSTFRHPSMRVPKEPIYASDDRCGRYLS